MKQIILFLLFVLPFTTMAQKKKSGVMDAAKILSSIPSRQQAIAEIFAVEKAAEEEMVTMDSLMVVMKNVPNPTPEQVKKIEQFELRIEQRQKMIAQDMEMIVNATNERYTNMMNEAIQTVSNRMKLVHIVDINDPTYTKSAIDVTDEILQEILKLEKENQ